MKKIAVIGAGIAGATLTRRLLDAGCSVDLFEKSRGTGGRLAASRLGEHTADLGAPILEAHSDAFLSWLKKLEEGSLVQSWKNVRVESKGELLEQSLWLGKGRNSALTRGLIDGATLHTETRVGVVWSDANGVLLRDEHGESLGYFDAAVVAAPAPQAEPLLEIVPRFAHRSSEAQTLPSWVALFELSELPQRLEKFEVCMPGAKDIERIIVESAKPNRTGSVIKVEMTSDWSLACIEEERTKVLNDIKLLLTNFCGEPINVLNERIHRWLYSRSYSAEQNSLALWDADLAVGACGDWINQAGIEGAWASANALADMMLGKSV